MLKTMIAASVLSLAVTACTSPIQKVAEEKKANFAELTDTEGMTTLFEVSTGKVIPDCASREKTSKMDYKQKSEKQTTKKEYVATKEKVVEENLGPCRAPFNFKGLDQVIKEYLAGKDTSKIKQIRLSVDWEGSVCRTIYDYANNRKIEVCR